MITGTPTGPEKTAVAHSNGDRLAILHYPLSFATPNSLVGGVTRPVQAVDKR